MMITRQIVRRHGRALVGQRICQRIEQHRSYAQDIGAIESSLENSLKETHSIESLMQRQSSAPVPSIDDETFQRIDPRAPQITEKHRILQHQKETSGSYGANVAKHYKPYELLSKPPHPDNVTPELLLASQAHLGHATALWNPMNSKYIYGVREGIHIISLEETLAHLRRASQIVSAVAERGGLILFAGTRRGQDRSVVLAAKRAKGYHIYERWIPGTISNKEQIIGMCRLKMVDEFDKELQVSPETLSQLPAAKPDLVVCLNPLENRALLRECAATNVPTIGIIDTDANPAWVTYAIPANDDSLRCTNLIAGVLGRAGQEGQRMRMSRTERGDIPYEPSVQSTEGEAVGELYTLKLGMNKHRDFEVEYQDEDGQKMSAEAIAEQEQQGYVSDESMMEVYVDGDLGDARDRNPFFIDAQKGKIGEETRPLYDIQRYGSGGPSHSTNPASSPQKSRLSKSTSDGVALSGEDAGTRKKGDGEN